MILDDGGDATIVNEVVKPLETRTLLVDHMLPPLSPRIREDNLVSLRVLLGGATRIKLPSLDSSEGALVLWKGIEGNAADETTDL